jgi:ACS family hexuronate transporter-like MFS transporter
VNVARKTGLLLAALGAVPIVGVGWLEGASFGGISAIWIAVPVVALAASSHQAWSSNMFTIVSDTLPKSAVATAVGIGYAFGNTGAALFQFVIAMALIKTGSYTIPFILAGTMYLIGWIVLHLLLPRLEPARIDPHTRPLVTWPKVITGGAALVAALVALQVWLNKPAYSSLDHYYDKRLVELKATSYAVGPEAKVGWRDARWIRWTLADGTVKLELLKFDRTGRPIIENAGAAATKYDGPSGAELQ